MSRSERTIRPRSIVDDAAKGASQDACRTEGLVTDTVRISLRFPDDDVVHEFDVDHLGGFTEDSVHLDAGRTGGQVVGRSINSKSPPFYPW